MEVFAELRSKKEIEADMSKLVSAFVSLAEDLLKERKQAGQNGENQKGSTTIAPAMPTVARNCRP